LNKLQFFDVFIQTPSSPGHAEDKGLSIKYVYLCCYYYTFNIIRHIYYEILDMDQISRTALNQRIDDLPHFPGKILSIQCFNYILGLLYFGSTNVTTSSFTDIALKKNKFTAEEVRSIRSYALFLFKGILI
jgi:hypothetical protein